MIEEPPLLKIKQTRRRPTQAQIDAFQNTPTGFVCDAMDGGGSLSADIRPLITDRPVPSIAGPALTADNGPADILATLASLHFIQPGDVLSVFGADRKVHDKLSGKKNDWLRIPGDKSGTVMVFRSFENASYALVVQSKNTIKLYDRVGGIEH